MTSTSHEALIRITASRDFVEKCATILIHIYEEARTGNELAEVTGFHEKFVKPRLSELKNQYGLVEFGPRKRNSDTGLRANTHRLTPAVQALFDMELVDEQIDLAEFVRIVFEDARADYRRRLGK